MIGRFQATALLVMLLCSASGASAHFMESSKPRTILVMRAGDEVDAFVRVPTALLFADLVNAAGGPERPLDTDFVRVEQGDAGPVFRVSLAAIEADRENWRSRLEHALSWSQAGVGVRATLTGYRIRAGDPQGSPVDAASARAALAVAGATADPLFDASTVDMVLRLDLDDPDAPIRVRSAMPPLPLAGGMEIDNHIIDARLSAPVAHFVAGQLQAPQSIDGSPWHTVSAFLKQGVLHILKGVDHLFLVICLALGIGARPRLLWVVTAFTLGHSATLIATFPGWMPSWPAFVPFVETAIAATVLYAAAAAYAKRMDSVAAIAGIGFLHGLGFSVTLKTILGNDAVDVWPALASYNLGIEFGQIAIIAATLATAALLRLMAAGYLPALRNAALAAIAAMSTWAMIARGVALMV